jgi:hypothetical protein
VIVRTVTAHCDRPGCKQTAVIAPDSTQPWRYLISIGWTLNHEDAIETFCPDHKVV